MAFGSVSYKKLNVGNNMKTIKIVEKHSGKMIQIKVSDISHYRSLESQPYRGMRGTVIFLKNGRRIRTNAPVKTIDDK